MASIGIEYMNPPRPDELQQVAEERRRFFSGEGSTDNHSKRAVRPAILSSWQRSRDYGVDPSRKQLPPRAGEVGSPELHSKNTTMIEVCSPYFDTVLKAWPEEEFGLVLSDNSGRVLLVAGHDTVLERSAEINVLPGAIMAEEHIGTAVANLVLSEGCAEYVIGPEHYCKAYHNWASLGAPIYDPTSRDIIGTVVAGMNTITHPHAMEMLIEIASQIEHRLHQKQLTSRLFLLEEYHRFEHYHTNDTLLALDTAGEVCAVSPSIRSYSLQPEKILRRKLTAIKEIQMEDVPTLTAEEKNTDQSFAWNITGRSEPLRGTSVSVRHEELAAGTILMIPSGQKNANSHRQSRKNSWTAVHTFDDLIGSAAIFRACLKLSQQAAGHDFPTLLLGESGTGKELLAQGIHAASIRTVGPFVAVNCGVTNDELLAAELFGYVDGAFTGAARGGRKGKIELPHKGTLFLDEVAEMPIKMQISLLRVLEEGKVTRVGGENPVPVDIRVIAASHRPLKTAVEKGRFRHDLYHRLAVFPIEIPPLRARVEDIESLSYALLEQMGFGHLRILASTISALTGHDWPGNIRELRNILLRAAHNTSGRTIPPEALPSEITEAGEAGSPQKSGSIKDNEQELIREALKKTRGKIAQAANQLGIHRATLYRKMRRYGIQHGIDI